MSEENPTNLEPAAEPENQYEELSKSEAMAGVFTAPGDTFETIANTPKKNYWLIPVLIMIVAGIIATFLFMRDADLVNQTMEKQKQKVRQQMEEKVKAGSMTREEADAAVQQTEKFMSPNSIFFKAIGYGGSIVGPFIILFILSLIYLVALKIMKVQFEFINILNVVGLAMLISAIGSVLGMVISVLKGEVSTLGLGLLLSEQAVGEKVHSLLTKLDVFSIWFYAVIAIGLSKVARIDMFKSASVVFGLFLIYVLVTSLVF